MDIVGNTDQATKEQRHGLGAIVPGQPAPNLAGGSEQADARVAHLHGQAGELTFGLLDHETEDVFVLAYVVCRERGLVGGDPRPIERTGQVQISSSSSCQLTTAPYSSVETFKALTIMSRIGR